MAETAQKEPPVRFETDGGAYRHWRLDVDGRVAWLTMKVDETAPLRPGYSLKLNSYDLGVDIELASAIERLRFEHPSVAALVVTSGNDRMFSAGANIYMLGLSSHPFKVNFCKFTNETRLALEDLSRNSGCRTLAAVNGTAAGGGYELAIACDEIALVEDGNSAVSLPEVPLLGVLPGTGGLTRLVDKRKVRRDFADVFSTIAEGIKGKRAKDMNLVDWVFPRSVFSAEVKKRAAALAERPGAPTAGLQGIKLGPVGMTFGGEQVKGKHVELSLDRARRVATVVVRGPDGAAPATHEELMRAGSDAWSLRAFRELDQVLLQLRLNEPEIGVVLVKTAGKLESVQAHDQALETLAKSDQGPPGSSRAGSSWLAREIVLHQARVLRRMDATAKSFFAIVEPGSCFGGSLLELALASDRIYALDDPKRPVSIGLSPANAGSRPMSHGLSRLQSRFLGDPPRAAAALEAGMNRAIGLAAADDLGLVTFRLDPLDWDDEVRVAVEERASLSPDALTGMEASLRFGGPETCDSKIFGRLTAWQNWIFQRPNAVGDKGALTSYGKPTRPSFDYRRT
jgi:benzoyl-CoA-dihydrodiol lyase